MAACLGMTLTSFDGGTYWPSALSWMFSSLHTSVGFAGSAPWSANHLRLRRPGSAIYPAGEGVFDSAGVFAGQFCVCPSFGILIECWRLTGSRLRAALLCGPSCPRQGLELVDCVIIVSEASDLF